MGCLAFDLNIEPIISFHRNIAWSENSLVVALIYFSRIFIFEVICIHRILADLLHMQSIQIDALFFKLAYFSYIDSTDAA